MDPTCGHKIIFFCIKLAHWISKATEEKARLNKILHNLWKNPGAILGMLYIFIFDFEI